MAQETIAEPGFIPRGTIEEHAAHILRHNHFETIPVDPIALATKLGITVNTFKFFDPTLSGMLVRRPDRAEIFVRAEDPLPRQCFTVAHELGHYYLHPGGEEFIDGEVNLYRQQFSDDRGGVAPVDRWREVQANMFAAALLMPENSVRSAWEHQKSVRALARMFGVSQTAMQYRIDQLGIW